MKMTFTPSAKYKGERTGLVVMGFDYSGLIIENTEKGLELSQVECKRADKGTPETKNATVALSDSTVYLRVKFSCDDKKIAKSEGGHDLVVMCDFSYSLDGKNIRNWAIVFRQRKVSG